MANNTGVEPVSYIYIINPTGCQNNPGRVFPLDASASIPVLVELYNYNFFMCVWGLGLGFRYDIWDKKPIWG